MQNRRFDFSWFNFKIIRQNFSDRYFSLQIQLQRMLDNRGKDLAVHGGISLFEDK